MKRMGIEQASQNLPTLIDEVEKGGEVILTRDGHPVAKLVPCRISYSATQVDDRRKALLEIREMAKRRGQRVSIEEIKAWIDEGRP